MNEQVTYVLVRGRRWRLTQDRAKSKPRRALVVQESAASAHVKPRLTPSKNWWKAV